MSAEPAITLYDISSTRNPQAWSPNTYKARLVLNYKQLPYKTVWVSYPDIKETVQRLGGTPTATAPDGVPLYTLPMLVDTSGGGEPVVITESRAIATYLDATYPSRPVLPPVGARALERAFEEAAMRLLGPHFGKIIIPSVWAQLDARGQPYFRETRERWYGGGQPLETWSPLGSEVRETHWVAFERAWDQLAAILDFNGPGVEFAAGGTEPTWADFVIVGYLAFVIIALPEEWENRVRHWSGGRWERLWKLTEKWRAVH